MSADAPPDAGVTIRTAQPDDIDALVDLLVHGLLEPGREDSDDLSSYQDALNEIGATPGTEILVAEQDNAVVGMCQLITFRHLQSRGGRCAEIESMHVREDVRSRGIGAALIHAAIERARQEGCYRLQLTSNKQRSAAHRFYERNGFVATHEGYKRLL